MAAGPTDHGAIMDELLSVRVPPKQLLSTPICGLAPVTETPPLFAQCSLNGVGDLAAVCFALVSWPLPLEPGIARAEKVSLQSIHLSALFCSDGAQELRPLARLPRFAPPGRPSLHWHHASNERPCKL